MTKIVWEDGLEMQVRPSLGTRELFFAAAQRNFCVLVNSMYSKPSNVVTGDSFNVILQLCQWDARVALWVRQGFQAGNAHFILATCHKISHKEFL